MKKVLPILVLIGSVCSYAGPKSKVRWPAQESPQVSRNVVQCDFANNNLEISSLEIFASTSAKGSQVVLTNISSIVGISAHGGFKALSPGGSLTVSESMEIAGSITLAGNSATFNFSKGVGKIKMGETEISASRCTSVLK